MSPEQVRGGTIDARSDIYSFGVTLYEMLTGRKPFQADSSYTVLNAQLNQAPTPPFEVNPAISPELNNVVLRALAKPPEERFQTAEEFRNAVKALREPQTAQISPVATPVEQYPGQQYADAAQPPYTPSEAAFQPVPTPPGPPPSSRTGHRGLWIGLGAGTAILALVAVAWVLPRVLSTHASPNPAPSATDTSTPAAPATPASTPQPPASSPEVGTQPAAPAATSSPQTPEPPSAKPAAGRPSTHAQAASATPASNAPRQQYVSPTASSAPSSASSEAASPASVPQGPSPSEVRDAHDRYANLQARADSAVAGVEQIRSQQQAQGLDIRGDILTAMNRLHHQLNEAQRALDGRDIATANDYMNRAGNDVEKLEKFLGR
jgi:eukaryotic-like serine/threonine-protein kinase